MNVMGSWCVVNHMQNEGGVLLPALAPYLL